MKKLLMIAVVIVAAMSANAQEKGTFAAGLRGGVQIMKLEIQGLGIKETSNRFGIGAFGQYSLTNHWRVDLEGIYHPKKDGVSDFSLGLYFQYLFNVTEDFKIYPLLGYGFSFIQQEGEKSDTDSGIQLGLGLQYNLKNNWFVAGEYRYQPGIFGDAHSPMLSVGYRF